MGLQTVKCYKEDVGKDEIGDWASESGLGECKRDAENVGQRVKKQPRKCGGEIEVPW